MLVRNIVPIVFVAVHKLKNVGKLVITIAVVMTLSVRVISLTIIELQYVKNKLGYEHIVSTGLQPRYRMVISPYAIIAKDQFGTSL